MKSATPQNSFVHKEELLPKTSVSNRKFLATNGRNSIPTVSGKGDACSDTCKPGGHLSPGALSFDFLPLA